MAETFQCAMCQQTFDKGWTDEEAEQELAQNFTGSLPEDCRLLCDDCYQVVMKRVAERN